MSFDKVKQGKKLSIGAKQATKAIEQGLTDEVFVARDADPRITAKATNLCNKLGIKVTYVESMKQLGKACGIDVGAAIVAVMSE